MFLDVLELVDVCHHHSHDTFFQKEKKKCENDLRVGKIPESPSSYISLCKYIFFMFIITEKMRDKERK